MSTSVGGIYAELSIDDTRFQRTLDSAQQGFTSLRSAAQRAANEVDRSFRDTGSNIERGGLGARNAARDMRDVGNAAGSAANDMGRVGNAARDAARDVGRVGDAAQEAARAAREAEDAVDGIGDAADRAGSQGGDSMGSGFLSGFTDKIKGLGGKGGPIAMALVGVAGIGLAAGAVLVSAIADGMEDERARDLVQARLGVNEGTARVIGAAAGDAYSAGWGESVAANMETARGALLGGLLTGEETAAEMQPLIEQLTAVNELLGEDMTKTISAVRALMLNGLARDSSHALDLITRSMQRGGDIGEDLLDSIREYSNGWKQTGFSAEFTLGLINQALANGADWGDRPADAIREFGRRMYEEADTIKETLTELQLPADELFDRLKAGGPEAEAAFDQIFDAIRVIPDPLERAAAAQALLGDTAGDFIDAFTKWDPSEAVDGMRDTAGAAEEAMRVMGSNSATRLEAAKNSISTSMSEVKLAMAEAFGPTLQKIAEWISTHKPEILRFFTGLADAGLACLEGLIRFASGTLRAFAELQDGIGTAIGGTLETLGGFAQGLGGVMKHIPGLEDTGEALESVGGLAEGMGRAMGSAAEQARALADKIDGGLPTIAEMREHVRNAGTEAANAAELTRLFGGEVAALPDGKALVVEALTEDAMVRLRDFGFTVDNLPDGTSRITANTAEGQTIIDDFVSRNDGRRIPMQVDINLEDLTLDGTYSRLSGPQAIQRGERADGGIDLARHSSGTLPRNATIKSPVPQLIQWAEPETGGEAFIPLALGKRGRSTTILAEVAKRFGYSLLQMADGGVRGDELTQQARGIEGAQYVWGGWDDSWNTDCSGAASKIANLVAYGDPMVGGRFATGNQESALRSRGFLPGPGPEGSVRIGWVHDPNMPGGGHTASTLHDGTHVEMGGDRGDGQFGGRAAGAMDFPNVMHYPMPPSVGPSQSRNYKARAEDFNAENDPAGLRALTEAGDYTDRFRTKYGAAEDDPLTEAFLTGGYDAEVDPATLHAGNDPDGLRALMGAGDYTARFGSKFGVAEDDPLVDALLTAREERRREAERAKAESASRTASSSGSVQDVRVTNWPESLGGLPASERQPIATLSARWFADGSEDHRAQIAQPGDLRVWAEPETGGEAYIPLAAAKRARSTAILRNVASRFGFTLTPYAVGGFGGLGQDGDGGVHTGSWELAKVGERGGIPLSTPSRSVPLAVWSQAAYRAAALGAGVALTAATGWDSTGKFVGFDTGNTSIPGLDQGLDRLSEQMTVLIEAVKAGKPVDVEVDIDSGRRTAELNIVQRGV
ncbi:phage tail tape measure protein [Nocardia puris]|uniref:phage tail tape measure protein n=1 Tax=Nocardia puris TaxID=208602 RepID=UPI001895F835|nr:phage tail tape measure protein [Nocardia puris]MBF6460150.1 phage tail tape measure protein [Nocardia puris]